MINMTVNHPLRKLNQPYVGAFPAAVFLILSAGDLVFSLQAFAFGVAEGNPFMAYLLREGLFLPGKIALSLLVASLMVIILQSTRKWSSVIWGSVAMMVAVNLFHSYSLFKLNHII